MLTVAGIANVTPVGSGEPGMGQFLVEWYGQKAGAGLIGETAGRLNDGAASISAGGTRIRLLIALAIPTDDYAFVVFAADSADAVARVCVDAGAPPDRISAAVGWLRAPDC